jgi:hypothetical protein
VGIEGCRDGDESNSREADSNLDLRASRLPTLGLDVDS